MEGAATGMSAVFSQISSGISAVIGWVGDWLEVITGNEILLFFCIALPLLTIGLSILKSLLSVRA